MLLTIALMTNAFVIIYVLSQKRKNAINKSYVYYLINFSYEFINIKRNLLFYVLVFLSILSIIITLTTGLVIKESVLLYREYHDVIGPLFFFVLTIANILPGFYGLYLIFSKTFSSESILIQRSAQLIIAASLKNNPCWIIYSPKRCSSFFILSVD